jgi:serine/threonine protein phosphatase PrpC
MTEYVVESAISGLSGQGGASLTQSIYCALGHDRTMLIGYASSAAGDKSNEDCFGVITPDEIPEATERGIALAVADGGSASGGGRVAAEVTVRTLLTDLYATPAHWGVERAVDCVLRSVNDWLYVQNSRDPDLDGVVTTLSMLLFHDGKYHIAHVGDSRVYRRRNDILERLTVDHTWPRRDMRHVLRRAIGLDSHLVTDMEAGEVEPGDIFLIASDGVWEVLGNSVIDRLLASDKSPDMIARELVDGSLRIQRPYMGRNDATAVVARIDNVGS